MFAILRRFQRKREVFFFYRFQTLCGILNGLAQNRETIVFGCGSPTFFLKDGIEYSVLGGCVHCPTAPNPQPRPGTNSTYAPYSATSYHTILYLI